MPMTDGGWVVTPPEDRIAEIRSDWNALVTDPLTFETGTWEGGATEAFGRKVFEVDQGVGVAVEEAVNIRSATGGNLDRLARTLRKPATKSRYYFYAVSTTGTVVIPAGTVFASPTTGDRWVVLADTSVDTTEDQVLVEAETAGVYSMPTVGTTTLRVVTLVARLGAVTYDPGDGDPYQVGRAREEDAEFRARAQAFEASGKDRARVRDALLNIAWIRAVSLARPSAGVVAVSIYPTQVGDDQAEEVANAIAGSIALGIDTSGSQTFTITEPDDGTDVIRWTGATTLAVTVALVVTLEAGHSLAEVTPGIVGAVKGVFQSLNNGGPVRRLKIQGAVSGVAGVAGITTLTLNGSAADITPSATQLAVLAADPTVTT